MTDQFDISEFIGELGAGTFEQKMQRSISETAMAVMVHERGGEITVKFKVSPISSSQAKISHSIVTKAPTQNGEKSEKNTTDTVMYVGPKGKVSVFPENQMPLFGKKGETVNN